MSGAVEALRPCLVSCRCQRYGEEASLSPSMACSRTARCEHDGASGRGTIALQCPVLYGDEIIVDFGSRITFPVPSPARLTSFEPVRGETNEAGYDKLKPAQP